MNYLNKGLLLLATTAGLMFVPGCPRKNNCDECPCKTSCEVTPNDNVVTIETDESFQREIQDLQAIQNNIVENAERQRMEKEKIASAVAEETIQKGIENIENEIEK
jgi:hypothetical protein